MPRLRLFCAIFAIFALSGAWLLADLSGSSTATDDFGAYLAQHQSDLAPFFSENGAVLVKDALPLVVAMASHILLVTSLVGCLFDVLLAWGFSTIAAPAYAKITRALIYATGRLGLALVLTIILSFAALLGINAGAGWPALLIAVVLTVPAIGIQIFWVGWLYRTSARESSLFYAALLVAHLIIGAILVPVFFSGQIDAAVVQYVDNSVTPRLAVEAITAHKDVASAVAQHESARAQVAELQDKLAQDKAAETSLHQAIEEGKNSPAFLFSRLVLFRAQGNLTQAATGLADFIAHHPHDSHLGAARGQLSEINQEVAIQLAAQKQEKASTDRANAQARAHLLARAAAGQATLSEMRSALLGKTTAQVYAIFGAPTERGADRWGYAKRMVVDPQASVARGLTVVFADGLVQGVDYYYGEGP